MGEPEKTTQSLTGECKELPKANTGRWVCPKQDICYLGCPEGQFKNRQVLIRCMCENTRCDFKLYQKHTENFEFIISPFWLEMLNFKCLPRPEMDINIGNGQVGRLKLAKSGDDRFEKPNSDEVEKLKRL